MNPLRWDVLGIAFLLALPLLALWYRGDLALDDVTGRLPWCFLAGWGAVALLRWATTPRTRDGKHQAAGARAAEHVDAGHEVDGDHAPAV